MTIESRGRRARWRKIDQGDQRWWCSGGCVSEGLLRLMKIGLGDGRDEQYNARGTTLWAGRLTATGRGRGGEKMGRVGG